VFEAYPKTRPPLPPGIAAIYQSMYKANRLGQGPASSLSQRVESWMHRQVAADVTGQPAHGLTTLEVGAGSLNQLPYEPPGGTYDIVEPFEHLYRDASVLPRVGSVYADIADVPDSRRYDRITTIAALEHICDLPDVVAKAGLLLRNEGTFRAAIPSEGTPLWTLGWRCTTGLEFWLKHGLNYGDFLKHEHVNTAREIESVLRYFFGTVETRVFGIARRVSLYQFHVCRKPAVERCLAALSARERV
jgi:hypothetical protein